MKLTKNLSVSRAFHSSAFALSSTTLALSQIASFAKAPIYLPVRPLAPISPAPEVDTWIIGAGLVALIAAGFIRTKLSRKKAATAAS